MLLRQIIGRGNAKHWTGIDLKGKMP